MYLSQRCSTGKVNSEEVRSRADPVPKNMDVRPTRRQHPVYVSSEYESTGGSSPFVT